MDDVTNLTEAMIRLRKAVDGIETSDADIAQTLADGKYGKSFMMELIPAQAPGAWPKIDSTHVMAQIKTIWAEHHCSETE